MFVTSQHCLASFWRQKSKSHETWVSSLHLLRSMDCRLLFAVVLWIYRLLFFRAIADLLKYVFDQCSDDVCVIDCSWSYIRWSASRWIYLASHNCLGWLAWLHVTYNIAMDFAPIETRPIIVHIVWWIVVEDTILDLMSVDFICHSGSVSLCLCFMFNQI